MSEFHNLRQKFEPTDKEINTSEHVVIDVNKADSAASRHRSRRISLKTMEWLNGKVDSLRQKFASITLEQTSREAVQKRTLTRPTNNGQRRISQSDVDLLEMCRKYQLCGENKYTLISEPFELVVSNYGSFVQEKHIEIHRDRAHPPRGILLLPVSYSTSESLLDFSEMGGYSLGRGSRVAKKATKSLSRAHCMIYLENNDVFVKDLDSKTGTFVNGRLLGSSLPKLVENYDVIQMGYGAEIEDFVQFMAIFLDNWDQEDFESIVQSANYPTSYSRTFSNSLNDLMFNQREVRKETASAISSTSPLNNVSASISSPKMTLISSQQSATKPSNGNRDDERIVFEMPRPYETAKLDQASYIKSPRDEIKFESPKIQPNVTKSEIKLESPKIQQDVKAESPKYISSLDIKVQSPKASISSIKESRLESPKMNPDSTFESLHHASPITTSASSKIELDMLVSARDMKSPLVSAGSRPPVPKPRRTKKNLSRSAEWLVEVDVDSELKSQNVQNMSESEKDIDAKSPLKTVKMPIEAALAARKSSVSSPTTLQPINIAIPEFLRVENLKIPAISPALRLITTAKPFDQRVSRKFGIAVSEKRKERVAKMQKSTQFSTIVQGATVKRIENYIDFGTASSDIADGFAESFVGSRSFAQAIFHNYRISWNLEFINESNGCKYVIEAGDGMNRYNFSIEIKSGEASKLHRIGQVEFAGKTAAKIIFKIDDSAYKAVKGVEIDSKESLPLRALQQLSYFYPHLEMPTVIIQGAPSSPNDKVTISQVSNDSTKPLGKLLFEGMNTTWKRRKMSYAIDLDTSLIQLDTIMTDVIQASSIVYCLRYHLD